MMNRIRHILISILFLWTWSAQAQGILFSEYRLVFTSNTITSIQVCNPTAQTRTFNISVINKLMDNQGVFHAISDSITLESSLKPYLRIFPRTMRLAPNECQQVQVQLKVPATLPDGEYRSYIHFLPLEPIGSGAEQEGDNGVKFAIKFRVGAAIPVIYRKHTSLDKITLDSVYLTPAPEGKALLHMAILRSGSQSLYTRIAVQGVSKGEPIQLTELQASAVYPEMQYKSVTTPISIEALDRTPDGHIRLTISLIDAEKKEKEPVILLRKEVDVGLGDAH